MPSSSDHARLAYKEASSELFDLFDQTLSGRTTVPTVFFTEDGAAELYLVDNTYALIAQGVGRLNVDLVPGLYQVRQRVGDTESVHEFRVVAEQPASFSLPLLEFPTAIPLPKSTLVKGTGLEHRVLDAQKGNFRLLLWAPVSNSVSAVVLAQALETLSLETFDGQRRVDLAAEFTDNSAWIALDLQPGSWVLVQQVAPGRQRCLPLRIVEGLVTSVYLLLLRDESGREIPLQLQHVAVALLPSSMKGDAVVGPLRRLEAARKALALGRRISGWSTWDDARHGENPLLALMDDHLAGASAPFEGLSTDDEWMALDSAPRLPVPSILTGPPLLRPSWRRLLTMPSANAELLALFPFDYQVEGSNAWFIWNEVPGARASRVKVNPPEVIKAAPKVWGSLMRKVLVYFSPRKSADQTPQAVDVAEAPTYEELIRLFSALIESRTAREWLRKTYRALENHVEGEKLPAVQRMFGALVTVTDKTLLKAMGAEELVRSALSSLELPKEQRTEHARSLLRLLQQQLSENDRILIGGIIGAAGQWLLGQSTEERPQEHLDRQD